MPSNEIYERANGIMTGADIDEIRSGREFEALSRETIAQLFELPFELVELYNRDPNAARAEIEAAAERGAGLIVLDYLQVFSGRAREASDDFHRVKVFSESLREVALRHKVQLLVLSSLNRSETQDRLSLNSFYGSSGLGHDASVAMLLAGEQSDHSELISKQRSVTLKVVKNRTGARGQIELTYHLASQRMEEAAAAPEPDHAPEFFGND